jgi:hypothetical protein
MSSQSK